MKTGYSSLREYLDRLDDVRSTADEGQPSVTVYWRVEKNIDGHAAIEQSVFGNASGLSSTEVFIAFPPQRIIDVTTRGNRHGYPESLFQLHGQVLSSAATTRPLIFRMASTNHALCPQLGNGSMKLLILTQNENVYLPTSFATVCRERHKDITCIVIAPAMSTHGGPVKGLLKHIALFGLTGTATLASSVLWNKLLAAVTKPTRDGPYRSIPNVAKAFDIPLHTVAKLKSDEFSKILDKYQPDLLISISCPQIVGRSIRARFPLGCINVHGGPLPKYRGLMPAFWALACLPYPARAETFPSRETTRRTRREQPVHRRAD